MRQLFCEPADDRWEAVMKLVLFEDAGHGEPTPGLWTERGVIDISGAVERGYTAQLTMQGIIDGFDRLRPAFEKLAAEGSAVPLARCTCVRHCRGQARSSAVLPITGSMRSARRSPSICF
jgi:hypothetical protein